MDSQQQELYQQIQNLRQRIDELAEQQPQWKPESVRDEDESHPGGHRTYYAASRHIIVAHDHLSECYRMLTNGPIGIATPYTLLRPALESSLWSIWLLDPPSSATRRKRGLWMEIDDTKNRLQFTEDLSKLRETQDYQTEDVAKFNEVFKAEAESLGCSYVGLGNKRPTTPNRGGGTKKTTPIDKQSYKLTKEIENLAWLSDPPSITPLIRAQWRFLSGYEHGMSWSLVLGSDHTNTEETPKGRTSTISVNDAHLMMSFSTCLYTINASLVLFLDRCGIQVGDRRPDRT